MIRYNSYKDSGIDWLGEIPEHWEVKRVKDIFNLERGKFSHRPRNDERMYENGSYPFIQTGDVAKSSKYVFEYKQVLNDNGIKVSKRFSKGTLLMTIAANIGDVSILNFDAYLPDSLVAFHSKYCIDFYYYLLLVTKNELDTVKVTNTQDNLNLERLNSLFKIFPPILEQTAIAQYLDTKTEVIDKKVSLLEKKVEEYKKLKKSLINEVVTKGLNKNVKLKDSGIDWIGQIPEHWKVKRFKDVINLFTGNSISDKNGFEYVEHSIPYVSTKDIDFNTNDINYHNGMYILNSDKTFKRAKKGTCLICIEGANAGKKYGILNKEVAFVNKLAALKFIANRNFDKYLYYYIQSIAFSEEFFSLINGLIGGVSVNKLKEFNIILPAKSEQHAIASYLDAKTNTIDKIIANIQTQISSLKALRKTLINDVVTGKIKVCDD